MLQTAGRTQALARERRDLPLMATGELPPPREHGARGKRREQFENAIRDSYAALANLGSELKDILEIQRRAHGKKCLDQDAADDHEEIPP